MDTFVSFFADNGLIVEMIVSMGLFAGGLPRRSHFPMRVMVAITFLVAATSVWSALVPDSLWFVIMRFVIVLALTSVALAFSWRLTGGQVLFYLVLAAVLQHFAFRGATIVTWIVQAVLPRSDGMGTIMYPLALVPFFAIGYVAFARPLRSEHTDSIDNRTILLLLGGMLLFVNVFTAVFDRLHTDDSVFAVFSLLDLVTCVFLLSLTTQVVRRENAEHSSEILRHLLRQQKTQMEASQETIQLINVKTHDLKHQIGLLGDRIPDDEVAELQNLVNIYDSVARTGNEPLDILLAQKSLICERRGIRFDRVIDGDLLGFMRPADVYSLFGNVIDNAIEAVDRIDDPDRRYVSMKVRRSKGMLAIHVENTYTGALTFVDGLPVTTKEDTRYHGFGMLSIRMLVERYEGYLSISARDGLFSLTVLLPFESSTRHA